MMGNCTFLIREWSVSVKILMKKSTVGDGNVSVTVSERTASVSENVPLFVEADYKRQY